MNKHVVSWCILTGVCLGTLAVTGCRPKMPANTPEVSNAPHFKVFPRAIQLSLRNNEITVGDSPFMLSSYDETGAAASMLSADLSCTVLNIEDIPVDIGPLSPKLGIQLGKERRQLSAAVLNRKKYDSVMIDSYGVAFPRRIGKQHALQVDEGGPFIAVRLSNGGISSKNLSVKVKTLSGMTLRTRLLDDVLIVERVSREPMRIAIKRRGLFGKKHTGVLFPMYRGATEDVVIYNLMDVPF